MRTKHKNHRLSSWDYAQNGLYFVTICTKDRAPVLGTIATKDSNLGLQATFVPSQTGGLALRAIEDVDARMQGISFAKAICMPDHLHLLVRIEGDYEDSPTLGDAIFAFKRNATGKARRQGHMGKLWQDSFYDHVVRGEEDALRIMEYTDNNPLKWALGKHDLHEEICGVPETSFSSMEGIKVGCPPTGPSDLVGAGIKIGCPPTALHDGSTPTGAS